MYMYTRLSFLLPLSPPTFHPTSIIPTTATGGDHSLFLVAHQAYSVGHGQFGQLGTGARLHVGGPVKVGRAYSCHSISIHPHPALT